MAKIKIYLLLILSLICTNAYAHDAIRGPVPNELISKLQSKDKIERQKAFSQLHYYMGPDVYKYLEEGINDQDLDIVRAALGPLTHCKSRFYPRYLELIKNPNRGLRYDAAVALVRSGDKRRFQGLLDLLKDTDNQIRVYAVDCLGEIGDKTAITPLWNLYNEEKGIRVKSFIIKSLAMLKDDKIMPYLMEDTKSKDSVIKYNAVTGLSYINNDESIKLLADLLKDGGPRP
ncbi:MAG: HEAT repeat domain-containing protein [bacterium]